eukprot:s77_g36.t1
MGAGGRTIVSLFRLSKKQYSSVLQPLSSNEMAAMAEELGDLAVLEIDEVSMLEKTILAYVSLRLQQWRQDRYHPVHCKGKQCCCGFRLPFGGVKVVCAGDFGQLPPIAVKAEKTLLSPSYDGAGAQTVNLGQKLFRTIANVFRLRRIHRQVGASVYKDSLLRLRDAAHTKEDVDLWQSHSLTSPTCAFSIEERKAFERERVHMFCETRRAGQSNGTRLGEHVAEQGNATILRVWSVDSTPLVERQSADTLSGLRRVLHVALGAKGGGGRNKRKVMRGDARDQIEETPVEEQVAESEEEAAEQVAESEEEAAVEEDDEEAYWRELMEEDAKVNLLIEAYYRDECD